MQPFVGNTNLADDALERAPGATAVTSTPLRTPWTKSGHAVAPESSHHPPLHLPPRNPKIDEARKEIGRRLPHLRSPSPLPVPPSPFLEGIEPSSFVRGRTPSPSRSASRR